jgi:hypothetical protein
MASVEQVKKAILKVAGNPESGVVADLAEEFARAVVALHAEGTKETRVIQVAEKR